MDYHSIATAVVMGPLVFEILCGALQKPGVKVHTSVVPRRKEKRTNKSGDSPRQNKTRFEFQEPVLRTYIIMTI